ncbi:MAG TPA: ABC transporter permease, partial [Clostridiaceae bacterium]|nr:ABC transporter permease [Clostridiaceae bacterium]
MRALISRNLKLYFRDKVAVFFSLLSVLIVIVLYVLFLAQMQIDTVTSASGGMISEDKIKALINTWVLAGLLSITTVTSTLGGYATMVNDLEKKKWMDFKSSPVKQTYYPVAQFISAFLIGTVVSLVALLGFGGYIHFSSIYKFDVHHIIQGIGYIILSALMNA